MRRRRGASTAVVDPITMLGSTRYPIVVRSSPRSEAPADGHEALGEPLTSRRSHVPTEVLHPTQFGLRISGEPSGAALPSCGASARPRGSSRRHALLVSLDLPPGPYRARTAQRLKSRLSDTVIIVPGSRTLLEEERAGLSVKTAGDVTLPSRMGPSSFGRQHGRLFAGSGTAGCPARWRILQRLTCG